MRALKGLRPRLLLNTFKGANSLQTLYTSLKRTVCFEILFQQILDFLQVTFLKAKTCQTLFCQSFSNL